jgi:enamine deaminase RidA (YjgF/YER057c/UK114 family)
VIAKVLPSSSWEGVLCELLIQHENKIWDRWLPEGYAPARACVEAGMARDALLVEISVIAAEV